MTDNQTKSIDWKLDRDLSISIAEQIKGKIVYGISVGSLHPGEALPSVRDLAQLLKVSPVTVSKVYKELTREGLLVARPSIGVFVSEMDLENGGHSLRASSNSLEQIIENSIRQAKFLGYSIDEIHETWHCVEQRLRNNEKKRTLTMVGNFEHATRFYSDQIGAMLHDLNIEVVPLTFNQLLPNLSQYKELLDSSTVVVTLPQNIFDLRTALKSIQCRIVTIAFELSPITIQKLTEISPDQRVGIVSTFPEFVQTMATELASYGLNIHPPEIALIYETERIRDMLQHVDVLIYATGSEKVRERVPKGVTTIEFLHRPKLESVNRLRLLFT